MRPALKNVHWRKRGLRGEASQTLTRSYYFETPPPVQKTFPHHCSLTRGKITSITQHLATIKLLNAALQKNRDEKKHLVPPSQAQNNNQQQRTVVKSYYILLRICGRDGLSLFFFFFFFGLHLFWGDKMNICGRDEMTFFFFCFLVFTCFWAEK